MCTPKSKQTNKKTTKLTTILDRLRERESYLECGGDDLGLEIIDEKGWDFRLLFEYRKRERWRDGGEGEVVWW